MGHKCDAFADRQGRTNPKWAHHTNPAVSPAPTSTSFHPQIMQKVIVALPQQSPLYSDAAPKNRRLPSSCTHYLADVCMRSVELLISHDIPVITSQRVTPDRGGREYTFTVTLQSSGRRLRAGHPTTKYATRQSREPQLQDILTSL